MSRSHFFVLGATHHTAPLAVREKLALDAAAEAELPAELMRAAGLSEVVVLNTCNRVEIYAVAGTPEAEARVLAAFCARQRFDPEAFAEIRFCRSGRDAVQHLCEVAAGLDSQLLGETEIFGQVKEAYAAAQDRGATGAVLNRVFQKAFQTAKYVRTHAAVAAGPVSVANVAVDLTLNIFGSLASPRILLLGAGEIGEKTGRAFQSRGAASLTVASRRFERAMALATELGASALPFEQRETRLGEFDVVVCAAAAPAPSLPAAVAAAAMRKRPARPLLFIDLGLPRNVDPAAAALENVFLYDLDDLAKIAEENRAARAAEVERGRALLAERAHGLWGQIEPRLNERAEPGGSASLHPA